MMAIVSASIMATDAGGDDQYRPFELMLIPNQASIPMRRFNHQWRSAILGEKPPSSWVA